MRILLLLILGLLSFLANGQESTPQIYGNVVNATTNTPLEGATVFLSPTDVPGLITDENGNFAFKNIIPGRYILQIDFLGYQSQQQVEILVEAGRSIELNIRLIPTALDLPTAVVRAGLGDVQSQLLPGAQVLTIEETRRLPATFNDPARQLIVYPGVVNTNDQANNIAVRGNSPSSLAWRIEGVEIVNPNHLSNAGTRTDAITTSGGGVNILSAQMLNTSTFYVGAVPSQYGNVQGGLMDMKLRPGNREKWEGTFQIGLLGLDASFEGPFTKNKKASYLINYRYSTIGLLDALGVQLGDESIKYQDAALHINLPSEKLGRFSLFGIAGWSSNIFEAERDTSIWEIKKDRTDVSFNANMWASGITHQIGLGQKGSWNTNFVLSGSNSYRRANLLDDNFQETRTARDETFTTKIGLLTKLNFQFNKNTSFYCGIELNTSFFYVEGLEAPSNFAPNTARFHHLRPFSALTFQPTNKFKFNLGVSHRYDFYRKLTLSGLEPRVAINYFLNKKNTLKANYSKSQKRPPAFLYFGLQGVANTFLPITKNNNFALAHELRFNNASLLKTEIYYQHLTDAYTLFDPLSPFSSLNAEELFFPSFDNLYPESQGRNYGIEILWQKYIQEDFYFIINGSLFNSQYKNYDQSWRDTRYNSRYISNATLGKEFRWKKSKSSGEKGKTLGINIRLTYLGNLRYTPIDLEASKISDTEILDLENNYGQQLNPYFKGDLRIYLRTDKTKFSNSLSLDVQNFLNRKNPGYFFYDPDTETIQEKRQLGMIPVLSWRLSL